MFQIFRGGGGGGNVNFDDMMSTVIRSQQSSRLYWEYHFTHYEQGGHIWAVTWRYGLSCLRACVRIFSKAYVVIFDVMWFL